MFEKIETLPRFFLAMLLHLQARRELWLQVDGDRSKEFTDIGFATAPSQKSRRLRLAAQTPTEKPIVRGIRGCSARSRGAHQQS
ncbi:hypothetical protein H6F61_04325 [Cyanobacteria bacterium FACHB-472]|nr:hypothetical protein [Cyanobacteria bacterium FACHB-472]